MKRNMVLFTGALALMMCLSVQAFAKGLYWESTRTGREGKGNGVSKSYYMPRMYKIVMEDNKGAVIIRLDKEEMLMLNHKKKTYQEMTFNEMETMMKGVSSQMQEVAKQMEKELAAMPAEQRKMVEQMMGKNLIRKQEEKTVVKTGETKNISNYACTKYILKEGDKDVATIWATKDIDDFKAMQQDMEEFGKRMATMMPGNLEGQMDRSIALVDGFPVRTEMTDGTTMTVSAQSLQANSKRRPDIKKKNYPWG